MGELKPNILCRIGVHRPLKIGETVFIDKVTGENIRIAFCSCGKEWLTDSPSRWFGFAMQRSK